jgi:phosphinothricin acetyltransferase
MKGLTIRPGNLEDLEVLTSIYNYYVANTPTTFDIGPFTPEERLPWLNSYATTGRYRLLVALLDDRQVGYATSSRFATKTAYDTSVETTIYLHPDEVGKGVGYPLYQALIEDIAGEDIHRCLCGITLPNPASIALHLRCGFLPVGTYHEVGRKMGKYWDVQWFARALEDSPTSVE